MTSKKSTLVFTASSVAALTAMPVALMSSAASASSCPTPSTLVAPGVCQILVTQSETLNLPSGITKLSAILVGGGGGSVTSYGTYGGGGGAVTYIDQVSTSAPLVITIGAGGDSTIEPPTDGGTTSIAGYSSANALGGQTAFITNGVGQPGASGNGNAADSSNPAFNAGGAGGAGSSVAPGPGLLPSSVSGVDSTLFPVIAGEVELGAGGAGGDTTPAPANSGRGGTLADGTAANQVGGSGEVILRFAAPVELAHTGANTGLVATIAAGLIASGAALVVATRRRFSRSK